MKVFLQRILQEIMKKNNTWNIRRLVDDSFVPSAQGPSVNLSYLRKWFAVHGEELYSEPKFLITAEVKMSVMFGPNI